MIPCILSADDDKKGAIDIHRAIIQRYGFKIRYTTKFDRIKKLIEDNNIDCIHLDILFASDAFETDWSRPNGLSVISHALKDRNDIPIMVISAYIDEKAKQMAQEYGISDLIYKWYKKPVDYEVIALDTIKAINEVKFKNTKDAILEYIGRLDKKNTKLLESALTTLPIVKHQIELKPEHLLNKLEDMSFKILANFELSDLNDFRQIVIDHTCDYFKDVSINHLTLADHFVNAISKAKDENIMTEDAFKLILKVIEMFRIDSLSEDEVYEARIALEDAFRIQIKIGEGIK